MKALTHYDIATPLTNGPLLPFAEEGNSALIALGNMIAKKRRAMAQKDRSRYKTHPFLPIEGSEYTAEVYFKKKLTGPRPHFTTLERREDGSSIGWTRIDKEGILFWKRQNDYFHFVPWPFQTHMDDEPDLGDKCREVVATFEDAKPLDIHEGALHRSFLGTVAYPFFGETSPNAASLNSRADFGSDFAIWCSHHITGLDPISVLIAGRVVQPDGTISQTDFASRYPFPKNADWPGIKRATAALRDIMNSKASPITYMSQISHDGPKPKAIAACRPSAAHYSAHQQMTAIARINDLLERARSERPVAQEDQQG